MDIMRVLVATDLQVRKKTLALVMDLLTNKNIHEAVLFLQKEVAKTNRFSFLLFFFFWRSSGGSGGEGMIQVFFPSCADTIFLVTTVRLWYE